MSTLGLLYREEVLTPGPEGLRRLPLPAFAAEVQGGPVRLACLSEAALEQLLPATASAADLEAAFEPGFLLAYEILPEGMQGYALEEALVRRLFATLPGLELLTSYPVVLRAAVQPPAETLTVVVEGLSSGVWFHAFRGPVVVRRRALDRSALLREVQQSLGAVRFDPLRDHLLATPAEAEGLRPTLEVEAFEPLTLFEALAALDPRQTVRFAPPEVMEREQLRAGAVRRRILLAGALGLVLVLAGVGTYVWTRRQTVTLEQRRLEAQLPALQAKIQQLLRPRYPALLRRRQPDWPLLLEELGRVMPPDLRLTTLALQQTAPFHWTLEVTAEGQGDQANTFKAIDRLQLGLAETRLLKGAEVTVVQGQQGVGVRLSKTW